MKVILSVDVPGTGKKGEIKEVSDGFARNFLLKEKKAVPVTPKTLADLKQNKEQRRRRAEKNQARSRLGAARLQWKPIGIKTKVNEDGTLYAAVRPEMLVKAIEEAYGIALEPEQVVIKNSIKTVGERSIRIQFGHGLGAQMTVSVVAE